MGIGPAAGFLGPTIRLSMSLGIPRRTIPFLRTTSPGPARWPRPGESAGPAARISARAATQRNGREWSIEPTPAATGARPNEQPAKTYYRDWRASWEWRNRDHTPEFAVRVCGTTDTSVQYSVKCLITSLSFSKLTGLETNEQAPLSYERTMSSSRVLVVSITTGIVRKTGSDFMILS